jgi:hypothetical protein
MESSAQTPAAQGVPQPPSTEMTEAITSPSKEVIPLNALLVEPNPLAFLETVAPDQAFVTMNTRAATLLGSPNLPEIPPSISRALIKDSREGQRTTNTSIINELAIRANENATATENVCSDLKKYNERLGQQREEISSLIVSINTLAAKLAAITPVDAEAGNFLFQYNLALKKLSGELTKTREAIPGFSLNATARLHQAVSKEMLRTFRYTTRAWHSAAEIAKGATYLQLVGVSFSLDVFYSLSSYANF